MRAGNSYFFSLAILLFAGSFCEATDTVRVRLRKSLRSVNLSGINMKVSAEESHEAFERVALPRFESAKVKMSWGESPNPNWKIQYNEQPNSVVNVFSQGIYIQGSRMKLGIEPVPSRLQLLPNRRGKIDVVTELDIESYLAGVLPSEMPASWPIEALKAQAVASRTYMRKKMEERTHLHFDLEASVHDQVFQALKLADESPLYQRKVAKALNQTRGVVLKDKRGDYLTAYYHSDCGGQTELPSAVWGELDNQHRKVKDPVCQGRRSSVWQVRFKKQELAEKLAAHFHIYSEPELESLFVVSKTSSHRVADLSVLFKGHFPKTLSAQEFRSVLGFDKVKSANFKLTWIDDSAMVVGRGNGHGVGMCQWGSKRLAMRGKSYRQILKHYYPKAILVKEGAEVPSPARREKRLSRGGQTKRAKSL